MPTEGPLTDAGLEIWPRGLYDLVMQITREYSDPMIEITESECSYLDAPYDKESGGIPDGRRISFFREELAESSRESSSSWLLDTSPHRIVSYQIELATTCGGPGSPSNISVESTSSTFLPRGTFSPVSQDLRS